MIIMTAISPADEVDDLIGQLKDPDSLVQCQAIEQLGQLKDKRAIDPLIAIILPAQAGSLQPRTEIKSAPTDPVTEKVETAKRACAGGDKHVPAAMTTDPVSLKKMIANVRSARNSLDQGKAIEALGATKDKRAVDVLLGVLNEKDFGQLHSKAIVALGNIGDPKAVPVLINLLKNNHTFNSKDAAKSLGQIGDPRAAEPLYQAMITNSFLREEGAEALAQLGGVDAVKYLNKAAQSEEHFIKEEAQKALDSLGVDHGLKPLVDLLKDSNPKVRAMAAVALTETGDKAVEFDLQEALAGLDEQTRAAIGQKQAQKQTDQATAVYDSALEANVRIAAIEALGQITDPKAVRPLLAALHDPDEAVCKAAGKALAAYKTKTVIRPIEITLNTQDRNVIMQALKDLGWIGSDYAVELIGKFISNSFVNRTAIEALGNTGNPKAIPYLEQATQSVHIEGEAFDAIVKINHPDSLKLLIKGLSSDSFVTRRKIVEALGQLNDPSIIEPLIELYRKNDHTVQDKVIDVLTKYDDPRINSAFAESLSDPFYKDKLLALLKERHWEPQTVREKTLYYMACEDWDQCAQLGPEGADLLLGELKKNCSSGAAKALNKMNDSRAWPVMLDCVKKWHGSKDILEGALKTGWKPQTPEEKIQAAVCKDNAEFMQLWKDPQVKEYFAAAINSDNTIALTIITLSVRYKLTEMVNPMISRFNSINDENIQLSICNQFLGSHNKTLYDAGKQWAQSKGLRIIEFNIPGSAGW
jgi:HEAT repeat protein